MNNNTPFLPRHVAIIPDGNRRWAKKHGHSAVEGHSQGASSTREIALAAARRGVEYLSIWGMSMDNIKKRSPLEVAGLLDIFQKEFTALSTSEEIHELNVKIHVIGHWREMYPKNVLQAIEQAIHATKDYTKRHLVFFLVYNGTDEMLTAVKEIADQAKTNPQLKVTPNLIKQYLFTKDLPPVDFLIRTGGEPHLSNGFMMWDTADSELYFTNKYWPEFNEEQLDIALQDFATRRRLKGK